MAKIKCSLKKTARDGMYIHFSRRNHGEEFVIENIPSDAIANVKRFCEVEVIDAEDAEDVESAESAEKLAEKSEKEKNAEKELMEFAGASWELAISQKEKIETLEGVVKKQEERIKELEAAEKPAKKAPRKRAEAKKKE